MPCVRPPCCRKGANPLQEGVVDGCAVPRAGAGGAGAADAGAQHAADAGQRRRQGAVGMLRVMSELTEVPC